MKARSPLLGYNHNIRYNGRLFHVQTEDSGVANPHVFTHLFFGGTILSSKRCDYDPEGSDDDVQRLMQGQHKSMLRELRDGFFDLKIAKFFGERVGARVIDPEADAEHVEAPPLDAPAPFVTSDDATEVRAPAALLADAEPGAAVAPLAAASPAADDATVTLRDPFPVEPHADDTDINLADLFAEAPATAAGSPAQPAPLPEPDAPPLDPAEDFARPQLVSRAMRPLAPPTPMAPPPTPMPPRRRPPASPGAAAPDARAVQPPYDARAPLPAMTAAATATPMPRSVFDLPPATAGGGEAEEHAFTPTRIVAVPRRAPNAVTTRVPLPSPPPEPSPRVGPPPASPPEAAPESIFGAAEAEGGKSLDDVILAYLSEDPPER